MKKSKFEVSMYKIGKIEEQIKSIRQFATMSDYDFIETITNLRNEKRKLFNTFYWN